MLYNKPSYTRSLRPSSFKELYKLDKTLTQLVSSILPIKGLKVIISTRQKAAAISSNLSRPSAPSLSLNSGTKGNPPCSHQVMLWRCRRTATLIVQVD